ncbi:conserved hypothetical protein [Ricinus communis]|uniref:Uncharacterized protein n=1 Tax=Ricinus communis TaxID=3988 RepID=B9RV71_RICCO|nr:conserved hypothetical protein [Ricinus communis]
MPREAEAVVSRTKPSRFFFAWAEDCQSLKKFTWWKEVGGKPYMKVQLDRALANAE